jgi:four helix bundle protein
MTKEELENRLIDFSVLIIEIAESLPNTKVGNHIAGQIIRAGTSPAFNYGEAQDAESTNDFIHKVKIVLKELRETFVAIKIIKRANLLNDIAKLQNAYQENNELIAIFVSTVKTSRGKQS